MLAHFSSFFFLEGGNLLSEQHHQREAAMLRAPPDLPKTSLTVKFHRFGVVWIQFKPMFRDKKLNFRQFQLIPLRLKSVKGTWPGVITCPLVFTAAASAAAAFPSAATSPLDAWDPIVFGEFTCLLKQMKKKN